MPEEARNKWEAMLLGYQRMPADRLFAWCEVVLAKPIAALVSRAAVHATCAECGEEILNEREIRIGSVVLCRSCAGSPYCRRAGGANMHENMRTVAAYGG